MDEQWVRGWLRVRRITGIGDLTLRALMEAFQTPRDLFSAAPSALRSVPGIGRGVIDAIRADADDGWAEREFQRLVAIGGTVILYQDEAYPRRLRAIPDAPPILYLQGRVVPDDEYAVAIVGARHASPYGKAVAERLSAGLARKGFTIVSGMARGIDGWAHRAALDAGGRSIAVLGCGIDRTYPPEHDRLKEAIIANGAIMSEFSLGTPPQSVHFPRRNRIISGLTLGTVIVEAGARSGSLITARLALEQGREVFAVPGNVGAQTSEGTNALIKQGAKLVETVNDIVEELFPQLDESVKARLSTQSHTPAASDPQAWVRTGAPPVTGLSSDEKLVYGMLSPHPQHIDILTQESSMNVATVAGLLLNLELKGIVEQLPGHWYRRVA